MTFSEHETHGMKNYYKSVAQLFNLPPLDESYFNVPHNHSEESAYFTQENAIMGTCTAT